MSKLSFLERLKRDSPERYMRLMSVRRSKKEQRRNELLQEHGERFLELAKGIEDKGVTEKDLLLLINYALFIVIIAQQ